MTVAVVGPGTYASAWMKPVDVPYEGLQLQEREICCVSSIILRMPSYIINRRTKTARIGLGLQNVVFSQSSGDNITV